METIARAIEFYRVDFSGVKCRSTETLVAMSMREIDGVYAVSVDPDGELVAVVSGDRDLHSEIIATVVSAGLLPEAVSVGPVIRRPDLRPLTPEQAQELGVIGRPREPVRAAVETVQRVDIAVTDGYDPDTIIVMAGVPVSIAFSEGHGCLGAVVFESLDVEADLERGGPSSIFQHLSPVRIRFPAGCGWSTAES